MVEKQELIDGLNKALSLEIGAILQYLHHSYEIMGPFQDALAGELSSFSKAEMNHMEYISKKIVALGGDPTTQPAPVHTSNNILEMLQQDLDARTQRSITTRKSLPWQKNTETSILKRRLKTSQALNTGIKRILRNS